MVEWKLRGRVQAQGGGIEESVPWAQMFPPTESEGHRILDVLHDRLTPAEQRYREQAFEQAHQLVRRAAATIGGMPVDKKSFPFPPRRDRRRVDVEVQLGIAFVADNVVSR